MAHVDDQSGLLSARLKQQQTRAIGRVVDISIDRAAKLRKERAERDRVQREAEQRRRRLEYFRALEAEDAKRLEERDEIAEHDARARDAERQAQLKAAADRER